MQRIFIEVVLFGAFCAGLAIVVKLTGKRQRAWVERDLYVGDLRVRRHQENFAMLRSMSPRSGVPKE